MSIDFATMFETAPMTVDERKTLALICQFYDLTKQQAADAFNNIFHRVPLPPGQTETPAEFAQMLYEWYIPRVTLDEYCLLRSCKSDRDDIERLLQVIFERGGIDKEPVEGKGTFMIKPIKRCEHNAQPMELTFSDAAILFLLRHKYGLDPIRTATAMGHVKRNIRPCSNDYCDAYVEALEAVFQDRLTFYSKIWNDGPAALGKADARALNAMKYHAIDPMTAPPTNTSPAVPEAAQSDPPPLGSSSPPYEQGKPGSRSSEDGTHTRSAMQEAMDQAAEHDPDSLFIPQDDT